MSTNMQTTTNSNPEPATSSTGLGGLDLSSGVDGAVTSALSLLQQILCEINYQELRQMQQMAVANEQASEGSAESIEEQGQQQFVDALAQGIGTIGGSFLSLGTMAYGEFNDPNKAELEQVKQEKLGVENYKSALPKEFKPEVDERAALEEPPVYGPKTEAETQEADRTAKAKKDHAQAVSDKLETLKKQNSFVDEQGQALKVSDQDKELMGTMDKKQVTQLNDTFDERIGKLNEREQAIASKQFTRRQTFSTIGQAVGQISTGIGTTIGAFAKKAAAVAQADAQLENSASQGMQSIMAQLLKTANDALSQAQQTIQTFATISNGNKFQG